MTREGEMYLRVRICLQEKESKGKHGRGLGKENY